MAKNRFNLNVDTAVQLPYGFVGETLISATLATEKHHKCLVWQKTSFLNAQERNKIVL